ncbi:hypothetical protein [uncultured Shewanella sp.]|uniref:hypothetical protein n=1 Tax=uncultured Shewanella sp. TaxID=173975 RepID=UPI0026111B4D|nr:hypothetical protein [uncultured Shewanella sp.]
MKIDPQLFSNILNLGHLLDHYQMALKELQLTTTINAQTTQLKVCKTIFVDMQLALKKVKISQASAQVHPLASELLERINKLEHHMNKIQMLINN